jgi:hypothetical protein
VRLVQLQRGVRLVGHGLGLFIIPLLLPKKKEISLGEEDIGAGALVVPAEGEVFLLRAQGVPVRPVMYDRYTSSAVLTLFFYLEHRPPYLAFVGGIYGGVRGGGIEPPPAGCNHAPLATGPLARPQSVLTLFALRLRRQVQPRRRPQQLVLIKAPAAVCD